MSGWTVAAALTGFLCGATLVISAQANLNDRMVERGLFTSGGHAYRLVEIKP